MINIKTYEIEIDETKPFKNRYFIFKGLKELSLEFFKNKMTNLDKTNK